jgi:preprotein translocase subunit SecB
MEHDPQQVDAKAYNSVVGRTTLGSIRLTESRFDMKPDALASDPDTWRKEIRADPLEVIADLESNRLYGVFHFDLACRHRRKKVLSCSARFIITFKVEGAFEASVGELFVQRVGKVMAYPYFRSTVAELVSQAAIQMAPLPMISLQPRNVKSAAELEESTSLKGLREN